jgi:predicted DNA-binding transcriptional regulator YafY
MQQIHQQLQAGRLPNATSLSKHFETSTKTITRDFIYMRDQLGLPLEWDASSNGYRYTCQVDAFPLINISQGELVSLLVAQQALAAYQGTPFHAPLASALQKLSNGLQDRVSISLNEMQAPVSFKSAGVFKVDIKVFEAVTLAVARKEELHLEYKNLGTRQWNRRHVQPLHICCAEGQWYVVCWDKKRDAYRTFALVRMRKLSMLGIKFEPPKDFDIQEHLKDAFSVFVGSKTLTVNVKFDAWAAELIQEKQWHPAQHIKQLEAGCIEFSIEVADLYEIERWILSWGKHAQVIRPQQLKNSIREHAQKMLQDD